MPLCCCLFCSSVEKRSQLLEQGAKQPVRHLHHRQRHLLHHQLQKQQTHSESPPGRAESPTRCPPGLVLTRYLLTATEKQQNPKPDLPQLLTTVQLLLTLGDETLQDRFVAWYLEQYGSATTPLQPLKATDFFRNDDVVEAIRRGNKPMKRLCEQHIRRYTSLSKLYLDPLSLYHHVSIPCTLYYFIAFLIMYPHFAPFRSPPPPPTHTHIFPHTDWRSTRDHQCLPGRCPKQSSPVTLPSKVIIITITELTSAHALALSYQLTSY